MKPESFPDSKTLRFAAKQSEGNEDLSTLVNFLGINFGLIINLANFSLKFCFRLTSLLDNLTTFLHSGG